MNIAVDLSVTADLGNRQYQLLTMSDGIWSQSLKENSVSNELTISVFCPPRWDEVHKVGRQTAH